jgi:hypothetical protein
MYVACVYSESSHHPLPLLQGVIWESMLFIQREAGADMAQRVENNLFDRYCSNNNFYVMSQLDSRIKDGEHRITDDVHGLFHWVR